MSYVLDTLPYEIIETIKGFVGPKASSYINKYIEEKIDELEIGEFPIEEALDLYFNTYICKEEMEFYVHQSNSYYEKLKSFSQWYQVTDRQLIEAILFYHTFELEIEEMERKARIH